MDCADSLVQEDLADFTLLSDGFSEPLYAIFIRSWALQKAAISADGIVDTVLGGSVEFCVRCQ